MHSNYKNEDGTPFTKEEFLEKLKVDKEFNNKFGNKGIDQISELLSLLKKSPDSRRMVVNAWAVHDLPNMVLPPCHYSFQIYTRELTYEEKKTYMDKHFSGKAQLTLSDFEKFNIPSRAISLMWSQRSADSFLGIPYNIASYALLLEILAKEVNMIPDELIGNLGDTHLYLNHIEQAKEQIERDFYELPTLKHLKDDSFYESLSKDQSLYSHLESSDFILENYRSHPAIKAPLSN
jgi:thymidylate synthase